MSGILREALIRLVLSMYSLAGKQVLMKWAANRLYIENSNADSTGALIYGEFDNDFVRINGKLIPTQGMTDGDMDTKIQVEESADEDISSVLIVARNGSYVDRQSRKR